MATAIRRLWVLYDPACGFCVRCAAWLREQRPYVPLVCLPQDDPRVAQRFPGLRPTGGKEELTVIDSAGGVYRGAKAWLMTLWALQDYRPWSMRLARPALLPLARNAFELVSTNRHRLSRLLRLKNERQLAQELQATLGPADRPRCDGHDPACRPPHASGRDVARTTPKRPARGLPTCEDCRRVVPAESVRCMWCGRWFAPAARSTPRPS